MTTPNDVGAQAPMITREFDAPRALVFKAWTEAERLARWWGPKGFSVEVGSFDLRPGGVFHYSQRAPNGAELWGKFVYHEVVAPERLVFTSSFADAEGNTVRNPWSQDWPLEILNVLTLTEQGSRTTLTMSGGPINASPAELATFEAARSSVQQGLGGTLDQLDAYLAEAGA